MSDYQGNIIIKNPTPPAGPSTYGRAPGMWKLSEVAYWIKQGVWPDTNVVPDLNFPYVSLLLSTTSLGNANNNLFVDSSGAFNPVSRNGNTTQGSFTPYSTNWSNYFDGSGDYLTVPDNAALDFGTGDFTIEMWINAQNLSSIPMFFHKGLSSTGWFFQTSATTLYFGQLDSARYTTWTVSLADNGWYHIALTRVGAVLNVFVNGVSQGAKTVTNANLSNDNGDVLNIGRFSTGSYQYQGYISNYRVVKGTAVYTSNFTPSTTPLTAISGTSLLTCQSNRFRDASTNNFTITVNGNTSVQGFSPFSPAYPGASYNQSDITNWSGYLNGSSYWTVPTSTALDVWDNGSGSFTVEAWIFATASIGNNVSIVAKAPNNGLSSWSPGWAFQVFNGYLNVNTPSDTRLFNSNTTSVPLNQWVHCALVKSGSTVSIYQNGVRVGTTTNSTAYSNTTDAVAIGVDRNFAGSKLTGYVSNVRMVKGTAVYDPTQSTLTVPTTNLTAVSGTSLLTLQSAAFTDNSGNNYLVNSTGSPTVTGNSPVNTTGYWSNYFDGSGDYLSLSSNAAFDCSTGDWTVEGWVNVATRTTNYPLFFGNNRGSFTTDALALTVSNSDSASYNDKFVFAWGSAGFTSPSAGSAALLVSNVTNSVNTWYHFAVVRNGTSIKMYRNGTEVASATISSGATFNWGFNGVLVGGGNWDGANGYINGYISNLRLVKGTAVYTAAFTPPTSPLTAISGTSLLTCQNGRYIDNSTNAFTVTRNGDVTIQSFDPFYTSTVASNGGSMCFDGTGDYLQSPSSPAFGFGTSDYTVEAWVYPTSIPARENLIYVTDTTGGMTLFYNQTQVSVGRRATATDLTATYTMQIGAWTHLAVSRQSGTTRLYANGVQIASTTTSLNYPIGQAGVGDYPTIGNLGVIGYLSNVRVTKSAVYTAAFTPPTAPLTPTANTTLLVNGMNAGIYDATTINDMETVGNAQVTTAVSKYGGSSVYFDGSGDYLVSRGNTILLGSGNFTVEFWVYFNAVNNSTVKYLYDFRTASATSASFLAQESSNAWTYWNGAGSSVTTGLSGSTFATGQWYHVAITRSSNVLYCFVNGTKVSSDPADSSNYASATMTLGARYSGSDGLNGYIDDVRLTAGVARYTANFTPPTQAFPVY